MGLDRQENDRQFWVAVPIVGIVLYVGLIAFHRYTQIGGSLSVDGLAAVGTTLVAAAAGFLAILYQVRSASRQLREQLADQHRTSAMAAAEQKRSVATAITFEVDSIYRAFIRDVEALLKEAAPGTSIGQELIGKRVEPPPFTAYEGCAGLLGGLPPPLVEGIVHFYGGTAVYLMTIDEFYAARQRAQGASLGDRRWTEVDVWVQQVRDQAGQLRTLAAEVSERLCEFAGIPKNRMAVLAEAQGLHAQTH